MKKKTALLATLIAMGVAGALYFGVSKSEASATPEQEAKQTATMYLEALENGNAEVAAKLVKDVRFKSYEETVSVYKLIHQNDPLTNFKVHSVKALDATHAVVDMEFTTKEVGKTRETFKMEKDQQGWKLVLDEIKSNDRTKK